MIIRSEQFRAFYDSRMKDFMSRLTRHLRKDHPAELVTKSDAELLALVRQGVELAAQFGIKREPGIAAFVKMFILVSPVFYEYPIIANILNDTRTPPDARVARLFREVGARDWQEASRLRSKG